MTSVASQLIEEFTAHAQSDSLEDAREISADGSYFPNNLRSENTQSSVYLDPIKAAISHSKPTFAGTYRDRFCAQEHDETNTDILQNNL